MTKAPNTETKAVSIIHFHGVTLLVLDHEGVEYIQAKPLVDLAGLAWRTAKNAFFEADNAVLYGTKELNHPVFAAEGHTSVTPNQGIYIRLDRSRMYLARIQTSRMKAAGKEEAAGQLLKIQIEWAEALHQYETNGIAYKKAKADQLKQLSDLIKVRNSASHEEKKSITVLVHQQLADLGVPIQSIESPVQELDIDIN